MRNFLTLVLCSLAFFLRLSHLNGTTFTFDRHSGVDSNWNTGTNWIGDTAPTSGSANLEIFLDSSGNSIFSSTQDISVPFELQVLSIDVGGSHSVTGSTLKFSNLGAAPELRNVAIGPSPGVMSVYNDIELSTDVSVNAVSERIELRGAISGTGGILKTGNNTLYLYGSGANTYSGLTSVNSGQIRLQKSSSVIAIPGDLTINGGYVVMSIYSNQIAATSNVTVLSGTLYLSNLSQSLPGLTMTSGYVDLGSFGSLTLTGNVIKNSGGDSGINGSTATSTVDLAGAVRQFDVDSSALTISPVIANGGINKTGSGTLTLNGMNTYAGGTTVAAGILQGNVDSLVGNISNSGTVRFYQNSAGTYNGVISGSGGIDLTGNAILSLGTAQTYTGLTKISLGTLATSANEQLADTSDLEISDANDYYYSGTLDLGTFDETVGLVTMSQGTITGSGVLTGSAYNFTGLSSGYVDVELAGSAQLTKTGGSSVTLSGPNSYTGGTVITQGSVILSGDERLADSGSVTIGNSTYSGVLSISGTETVGDVTITNGSISNGGTIIADSYLVQSGNANVNLSGGAMLTKTGTGTFYIYQPATYTGGTFVNAGILRLSTTNALASTAPVEVNGGSLQSFGSVQTIGALTLVTGNVSSGTMDAASYDVREGTISSNLTGSGALTKTTAGIVVLSGTNTYTGGTLVSDGVLAGYAYSLQGDITNNATLRFTGSGTYADEISGTGAVEINYSVTFTGANSYTGGTTVTNGTLLGDTTSLPGDISLANGNLSFNQASPGTFAGDVTGTGNLFKNSAGELTLSGNNSYSGTTNLNDGSIALASNTALGTGVLYLSDGTSLRAEGAARAVSNAYSLNGTNTFSGSEDLTLTDATPLFVPAGQTLISTNTAVTTIDAPVATAVGSVIHAAAGNFVLGDSTNFLGFQAAGSMLIDSGATLTLRSAGFVDLSPLTTLSGGTLAAPNGVSLGASENLIGDGTVSGKVAAQIGSVIAATTGDMTVGDATTVSGFFSDGELRTGQYTVTINDANTAVLGSLTTLGNGAQTGSLIAGNASPSDTYAHLLVEQGKNLIGRGNVAGHFKNHGNVIGDGTAAGERIVFDSGWTVTGKGSFENATFLGTFSPGESPGVVDGANLAFGGSVVLELGGLTPGSGANHHDQINDAASLAVYDGVSLTLNSWNQFLPTLGDEFVLMTWADGLEGSFSDIMIDPWFWQNEIGFELSYDASATGGALIARAARSADFNGDGAINGADLASWSSQYGAGRSGRDFLAWQRQFGQTAGSATALTSVPEPGSLGMLAAIVFVSQLCFRHSHLRFKRMPFIPVVASPRRILLGASCCLLVLVSAPAQGVLVVNVGEELTGDSVIEEDVINEGAVMGLGPDQRLVFGEGYTLSGAGSLKYTLTLGTYAPGNSPAIVSVTNQQFGGPVQIELGGTTPGFGANNHDQINDTAVLDLLPSSTLSILSFNGFVPTAGDTFTVMTWQSSLVGSFGSVVFDPYFAINGVTFQIDVINPSGSGSLVLTAVPEANAVLIWSALAGLVLITKCYSFLLPLRLRSVSTLCFALTCSFLLNNGQVQADLFVIDPTVVAVGHDSPSDGIFDSFSVPATTVLNNEYKPSNMPSFEDRTTLQFSLSSISGTISSAILKLFENGRGGLPLVSFYGYQGDGTLSLSNFEVGSKPLVAQVQTSNDSAANNTALNSIDLTSFVQQAYTLGATHIGITSRVDTGSLGFFYSATPGVTPTLNVTAVPEASAVLVCSIISLCCAIWFTTKKNFSSSYGQIILPLVKNQN